MEKRVQFRSTWLPWLLIAPKLVVIVVFFFWPAAQAVLQRCSCGMRLTFQFEQAN